jgi:PAS domain S-box-containing protein
MKLKEKTKHGSVSETKKNQKKSSLLKKRQAPSKSSDEQLNYSKWKSFLKNSLNIILIIDKNATILDINKVEKGIIKKEAIGQTIYHFIPNDSVKEVKKAVNLVFKTRKPQEYNTWRTDTKGNIRYYKARITPLTENNKVTTAIIDSTEITKEICIQNQLKLSEERYKHFLEQMPSAIIIYVEGEVVFVNKAAFDLLRLKHQDLKKVKKLNVYDYILPEYKAEAIERAKQIAKGKDLPFHEFEIKIPGGEIIYVESKSKSINYNGKPGIQAIINDISYRKKAELELSQSRENYKSLVDYSPDGVVIHKEGKIVFANPSALNIVGVTEFEEVKNHSPLEYVLPEYHQEIKADLGKLKAGEELDFMEIKICNKKGEILEVETKPILITYDGAEAIQVVFHDVNQLYKEQLRAQLAEETSQKLQQEITERKKAEEKLKNQLTKFNAIMNSSSHIIWSVDRNICLTTFNTNYQKQLEDTFGIKAEIGLSMITGKSVSSDSVNNFWIKKYEKVFAGEPQYFELQNIDKKGIENWREIYLNPIFDEKGVVAEVSSIGHDITGKKLAEAKIKQSLQEKEVLLKEVHHRVKNNLQVISSILNLQSSYVKDEGTLNILKESQNRIKSMAFIHESLYQTKDFSSINFSEYIINLSQNLIQSYANFDYEIKLNLDIQNVFLNLDLAIPCGLIINEIVSNALKYAFSKTTENGKISIKMYTKEDDLIIEIGDNGKGLPKHIDYRNTESLGLQLVVTLIEQLDGTIKLNKTIGTNYTIIFNQTQVKNRI